MCNGLYEVADSKVTSMLASPAQMRLRTSGVLVRARCMALGSTFGPGKQMPQIKIRALYLSPGMRHLSNLIEYLSDHCERSGKR